MKDKFKVMTLPLEKELIIKHFQQQIEQCSLEQLQFITKELHISYIVERFVFQEILKNQLGYDEIIVENLKDIPASEILEPEVSNYNNNFLLTKWQQLKSKVYRIVKILLE